jgi:hypothetical protein
MGAGKGLSGWVEIFRGGKQVDSRGRDHDGDRVIDQVVSSYDPDKREAPAVIGHPENDAPAFGWVEGVRKAARDGTAVLEARFKQVQPEFEEMVKAGLFKNRSIAVRRDGSLRHVGFLGAAPPAVPGLKPIEFTDDEDVTVFEFSENIKEDDVEKQQLEAALAAEKARADAAEARFAETESRRRRMEAEAWVDGLIKDGKALPGWKSAGLAEFVQALDGVEPAEFSEGVKKTPAEWFRGFMESLGAHGLFAEMMPPKGAETAADHTVHDLLDRV